MSDWARDAPKEFAISVLILVLLRRTKLDQNWANGDSRQLNFRAAIPIFSPGVHKKHVREAFLAFSCIILRPVT